jgi:hypothetical protein
MIDPGLLPLFEAQRERPAGPWHSGGPAPCVFDWPCFAAQALACLGPGLEGPDFARERLLLAAVEARDERRVDELLGPVRGAGRAGVHLLARALREGHGALPEIAAALCEGPFVQGRFGGLTRALDLAELASLLGPERRELLERVERVVFRGFVSLRAPPVLAIAALRDGSYLTVVRRRELVFTFGGADEALAAVPQLYFELALDALKGPW